MMDNKLRGQKPLIKRILFYILIIQFISFTPLFADKEIITFFAIPVAILALLYIGIYFLLIRRSTDAYTGALWISIFIGFFMFFFFIFSFGTREGGIIVLFTILSTISLAAGLIVGSYSLHLKAKEERERRAIKNKSRSGPHMEIVNTRYIAFAIIAVLIIVFLAAFFTD